MSLLFFISSKYWKAQWGLSQSFLFSMLNTWVLSACLHRRCIPATRSSYWPVGLGETGPHSWYWGLQTWTQRPWWCLTKTGERRRIIFLSLLALLLLVQSRMDLAHWAVSVGSGLDFHAWKPATPSPQSCSQRVLVLDSARCWGVWDCPSSTLHLDLWNFMRVLWTLSLFVAVLRHIVAQGSLTGEEVEFFYLSLHNLSAHKDIFWPHIICEIETCSYLGLCGEVWGTRAGGGWISGVFLRNY